jgi:hypothetical protein
MGIPMAEEEICLVDSGTTNTILRETRYFQTLTKKNGNIMTIAGWHDRLGHPRLSMMRRIIKNSTSHDVKCFPNPKDFIFTACAKGKLITRPSHLKIRDESPVFLQRIQVDICGPIQHL